VVFGYETEKIVAEKIKIRLGGKVVEAEIGPDGRPVIKARAEEIKHPDGRQDVIVHVPCSKIGAKQNQPV
jgi:hypothetical protein